MRAAVLTSSDSLPVEADFADPTPVGDATLLHLVGAGMHQVVRSIASGRRYGSTGSYPLVLGVDAVARADDGALVYTGWPRAPWGTVAELLATPLAVPLPPAFQTGAADPLAVAAGMNPAMSGWMPLVTHRDARGSLGTVLVIGATGMAGHLAVQSAFALGAERVIAAGRHEAALARAAAAGAEAVALDPTAASEFSSLEKAIQASTPSLVLDYVWGPAAETAFAAAAGPGGVRGVPYSVSSGRTAGARRVIPARRPGAAHAQTEYRTRSRGDSGAGRVTERRPGGQPALWQPARWSSTMPADCMSAYIVVGPTNRKPRLFSDFERASDAAVVAGTSANTTGRSPSARGAGANDHMNASSSPGAISSTRRAFPIVARILARLRMIPASVIRRSTSSSPKAATAAGSNPANTSRKRGRLRRIVIHDRPAWNPSSDIFSNSARSPCSGRPHSSSW